MPRITKLVLDVLKPRHPNASEFTISLADIGEHMTFRLRVDEIDEKTESVILVIEAEHIDYDTVEKRIKELGAAIHSIDEVEVSSAPTVER